MHERGSKMTIQNLHIKERHGHDTGQYFGAAKRSRQATLAVSRPLACNKIARVNLPAIMNKTLERTAFAVTDHQGAADADKAYWAAASRDERFAAVEMQRQIAYGYRTAPRLQRVFEVARPARR